MNGRIPTPSRPPAIHSSNNDTRVRGPPIHRSGSKYSWPIWCPSRLCFFLTRRRQGWRTNPAPGSGPRCPRSEDEAICIGYGFHPSTNAFAACLQRARASRTGPGLVPRPPPYWGRVLGTMVGAVLALAGGSAVLTPVVLAAHPQRCIWISGTAASDETNCPRISAFSVPSSTSTRRPRAIRRSRSVKKENKPTPGSEGASSARREFGGLAIASPEPTGDGGARPEVGWVPLAMDDPPAPRSPWQLRGTLH